MMVSLALPLMAIKEPGASGPLRVSSAPSWMGDTPATVASILGFEKGFDGVSVFDLQPGARRQRAHYFYEYPRGELETEYLTPIREYIVDGSVFDSAAWKPGAWFLPNGVVQQ